MAQIPIKKSRRSLVQRHASVCIALAVVAAGTPANRSLANDETSVDSGQYRTAFAATVREAARSVLDSIVTIEVVGTADATVGEVQQDAPTSGIIVDEDGYILASSIVVRRPSASLLVRLPDGTRHAAERVAVDRHRDLILLKIDSDSDLQPIRLPEVLESQVGQTTVAVGRYGDDASPMVSTGILSAIGRLDGIAIQTDARVSPSLYGGPLLDLSGNVLGVLIPAVAEGGAPEETSWYDSGIAFAIPANVIRNKLERLRRGEDIERGLIGIVSKSSDPYENDTTIAAVRTRSPAESAGLEPGDEVLSVAGQPVRRTQEIKQALGPYDAGDDVAITFRRDDETLTRTVTLTDSIPPLEPQHLGIIVADVESSSKPEESATAQERDADPDQTEEAFDEDEGATSASRVVVRAVIPGSPADGTLQPGDVVRQFGDAKVPDARTLRRLLITAEPEAEVELKVIRDESEIALSVRPQNVSGKPVTSYPELWEAGDASEWTVSELTLPDAANEAAWVRPKPDSDAAGIKRLGAVIHLLDPGGRSPKDVAADWVDAAAEAGVTVCIVAPQSEKGWQPREVEVLARMAALMQKQLPIEDAAVAVTAPGCFLGAEPGAADSMALVVALAEARTFSGVAVSAETKPPAVRLRENEPSTVLQLMLPIKNDAALPSWGKTLADRGYPIVRGGTFGKQLLLRWTRCLQAM